MKAITAFYAGQIYEEYDRITIAELITLPDGVYLYLLYDPLKKHWYLRDQTPVLLDDVPTELRLLQLLLT